MVKIDELIDLDDPAWPMIQEWANDPAANDHVILPVDHTERARNLLGVGVTTRSIMGAVIYETGGITFDKAGLRILGAGDGTGIRSFLGWNESRSLLGTDRNEGMLLIADDIFGGFYALNGGIFGDQGLGDVYHLAADDLSWVSLEVGYTEFLSWCFLGDLADFYSSFDDLKPMIRNRQVNFDQAFSFYPFLWSQEAKSEGGPDIKVIGIEEIYRLKSELSGV